MLYQLFIIYCVYAVFAAVIWFIGVVIGAAVAVAGAVLVAIGLLGMGIWYGSAWFFDHEKKDPLAGGRWH